MGACGGVVRSDLDSELNAPQTFPESVRKSPRADPQAHVFLYLPLGALLMRTLLKPDQGRAHTARSFALAVLLGAALAGLDEWHKFLIPTRKGEVADWLRDVVGVSLGAVGWAGLVWFGVRRVQRDLGAQPSGDGG